MSSTPDKKAKMDAENNGKLSKERLEGIKEALRRKRSELVEYQATQLSALYSPEKHHLADLEEMASDTMDTDSVCALVDIGSSTLAEIDAALERIDDGTYGVCELCEQVIHPDRLEILPFASLCVACQRLKERQRDLEGRQE
jgi:DnaK suppressor protein